MRGLDVAIYLRKSRADVEEEQRAIIEGREYDTLGKHRRELLNVAKQNNHNVIDIFEELISGEYIASRPAMQQLLKNIEADHYDAVLVVDIDRLGRGNKADQSKIENALKNTNTLIVTPSQIFDLTQEDGEFSVEVRTFLANMEYRSIKRRLQRGLINSASQGKEIAGVPYGYERDKDLRLVIKEPEASVVRDIFRLCLDGYGKNRIFQYLKENGIPSPSGKDVWNMPMIRRLLMNKKYAGYMVYGKRQNVKQEDGTYKLRKKRDESKYVEIPNSHEPIIPIEQWEQAQKAIKKRDHRSNNGRKLVYPLASLVRCKRCGRTLICSFPHNRKHGYLYCCNELCDLKGIRLDKVENAVMDELRAMLKRIEVSEGESQAERLMQQEKAISARISTIEQDVKKDETRKARVYESYEEGTYSKEMFLERLQFIQDKQRERSEELETLRIKREMLEQKMEERKNIVPAIKNVLEIYETADVDDKNRLLKAVIDHVEYNREPTKRRDTDFELIIHLIE